MSIPESKFSRLSTAGIAAAKVGANQLGYLGKRPFMSASKRTEEIEQLHSNNAIIIFNTLIKLRGSALKVAQMIGMDNGLLPEVYQKELQKACYCVPPLDRTLVRKQFIQQFNRPAEQLYDEFSYSAFAAASLGQVHKAKLGGSELAVKVQYPGIANTINNDVELLRKLSLGIKNSSLVNQAIDEIKSRLSEEVDYTLEANRTRWFQRQLEPLGVKVPEVYQDLSNKRILTMEYIHGQHINEWLLNNPTQNARDTLAQKLFDTILFCMFELKCVHADPNPGNYLFLEKNKLAIIDFGCSKIYSDEFVGNYKSLAKSYARFNKRDTIECYIDLGMISASLTKSEKDYYYATCLEPFANWLSQALLVEKFDFGANPEFASDGLKLLSKLSESSALNSINRDFIFTDRTLHGLFQIFHKMKARVRIRNLIDNY